MNKSKDPLLHLQFNELINKNGRFIVYDKTKNKYYVTVHGENLTVMFSDSFGSCLSFDENDYLELDHRLQYLSPTTPITFSIDLDNIQKEQCFFEKLNTQKKTVFWFDSKENTQPLVLEVTNLSVNTIVFEKIKKENAVEKKHFELLFRPQTFDNKKQNRNLMSLLMDWFYPSIG